MCGAHHGRGPVHKQEEAAVVVPQVAVEAVRDAALHICPGGGALVQGGPPVQLVRKVIMPHAHTPGELSLCMHACMQGRGALCAQLAGIVCMHVMAMGMLVVHAI